MTDLAAAWNELHDSKPDGWFVGQPMYHEHRREWEQYAFEHPGAGQGRPSVAAVDGCRGIRA